MVCLFGFPSALTDWGFNPAEFFQGGFVSISWIHTVLPVIYFYYDVAMPWAKPSGSVFFPDFCYTKHKWVPKQPNGQKPVFQEVFLFLMHRCLSTNHTHNVQINADSQRFVSHSRTLWSYIKKENRLIDWYLVWKNEFSVTKLLELTFLHQANKY